MHHGIVKLLIKLSGPCSSQEELVLPIVDLTKLRCNDDGPHYGTRTREPSHEGLVLSNNPVY